MILVLVVAFVLSMQTFLNIAVWVWLAEVFPLHMRGLGIGISVFFGWITNGFLALFFPSLVAGIGITGSFFLFAAIGVVALLFVYTQVPETRGRSLEALEEDRHHRARSTSACAANRHPAPTHRRRDAPQRRGARTFNQSR